MEIFTAALAAIVAALLFSAFKVLREYERGVIFMLGRFYRVKGPGLIILIPVVQQIVRVDLRTASGWSEQSLTSPDDLLVLTDFGLRCRVCDLYRGTALEPSRAPKG